MVQQPVEQRCGDHAVGEHVAPFAEAAIGRQDDRAALVAGVDELKEQIAAVGADGQVTDLVDDEQAVACKEAHALRQVSLPLGLGHRVDDLGQRAEVHALASAHGFHAQRNGQVRFARTGRPQEVNGLPSFDELELRKRHDAIAVEAGLEAEVVTGQRLDRAEPRGLQR